MATPRFPYALTGSGLTKTSDIGGSRFGQWSVGAFSPTSYVATTTRMPVAQLSVPPTYANLSSMGVNSNPVKARAGSGPAWSPKSGSFWVIVAGVAIVVIFVAKRKGKIR